MNQRNPTPCLSAGICTSPYSPSPPAISPRPITAETRTEQHLRQLASDPAQPGEPDLFFNGWTLLF